MLYHHHQHHHSSSNSIHNCSFVFVFAHFTIDLKKNRRNHFKFCRFYYLFFLNKIKNVLKELKNKNPYSLITYNNCIVIIIILISAALALNDNLKIFLFFISTRVNF
jgi:hypothetical protein